MEKLHDNDLCRWWKEKQGIAFKFEWCDVVKACPSCGGSESHCTFPGNFETLSGLGGEI